ncbi:MAG TPA: hypothetical protein VJK72_03205 [Candidatus Nanoarchaeia archaeon]|nr:hypothetical protein [Candidatus Nanoarchaeia archaeon]
MHFNIQRLAAPFRTSVYYTVLAAEALTWILLGAGVWFAALRIRTAAQELTAGQSPETFQNYLLSLPPEQLAAFAGQLKAFVIQFFALVVVVPIALFLVFAVSRAVVWHLLEKREWHVRYRRWIGMSLIAVVLFVVAFAIYGVLKLIFASFLGNTLLSIVNVLVLSLLWCGYLIMKFTAFSFFMKHDAIWSSWGHAFAQLKHRRNLIVLGSAVALLIVLQIVQYPLRSWYFLHPMGAIVVPLVLLLLFVTWLRLFVVNDKAM